MDDKDWLADRFEEQRAVCGQSPIGCWDRSPKPTMQSRTRGCG